MILTVCVAICLTAWLAIAKLQASEDPMDYPDFSKHTRMRSEIKAATARNFKGQAIRGHAADGSMSQHKNLGLATTKDPHLKN